MWQASGISAGRNMGSQQIFGYSHVAGSVDMVGMFLNAGHISFFIVALSYPFFIVAYHFVCISQLKPKKKNPSEVFL